MNFINGHIYHIYNRGNNRQLIFFKNENYRYFLRKVRSNILPLADILAFCLMPNHFHFMVMVKNSSDHCTRAGAHDSGQTNHPLVGKVAHLLSSYTRAINIQENRTGSLFTKKTKSKDITEREPLRRIKGLHPTQSLYALNCFHYIHQNPLKAGLVDKMGDWEFSSFKEFMGKHSDGIVNHRLAQEIIGFDLDSFQEQSYLILKDKDVEGIW